MVRKIQINMSNRSFYSLVVIGVFVLICSVYAYGTSSPSVMGHSINELAPPADCVTGQVLAWGGVSWMCIDMEAGSDDACPAGYESFTNQLGEICIPVDIWELSSSASGDVQNAKVTAESRIYNGVRQVRITECSGRMGSCTTDWSNDYTSCKYYVYDVAQYGCWAGVTTRYLAKAVHANIYDDYAITPWAETIFGPGLQLAIPVPEGVGIDVPKGEHKGGCVLSNQYYSTASCLSETWPGSCATDGKSCSCADGYRLVYRRDLFERDTSRRYHYDCVKN